MKHITPQAQNYDFGHGRIGQPAPFGGGSNFVTLKELKGSIWRKKRSMSDTDSEIEDSNEYSNEYSNDYSNEYATEYANGALKVDDEVNTIDEDLENEYQSEAEEGQDEEEVERQEKEGVEMVNGEQTKATKRPKRHTKVQHVEYVDLTADAVDDEW